MASLLPQIYLEDVSLKAFSCFVKSTPNFCLNLKLLGDLRWKKTQLWTLQIHFHEQFHKVIPHLLICCHWSVMPYQQHYKRERHSAETHCKGTKLRKVFIECKMPVSTISPISLEFILLYNKVTRKLAISCGIFRLF